jgi:hypothetical protein
MRVSLLNTPTEPFRGAATALYTDRGPARASPDYAARKPNSTPAESTADHVDDCLARVAGLTGRQRAAVKAEVLRMMRDIDFLRQLTDEAKARGPWSAEAVHPSDEGRVL